MEVTGKFSITLNPMDGYTPGGDGIALGHMSIDKTFEGELDAHSKGEMLSARTNTEGSAGYVAMEQVSGKLNGKSGSFVLQHYGVMNQGNSHLTLEVVPDSGTGELTGLSGKMQIRIENGQHFYDFSYDLV